LSRLDPNLVTGFLNLINMTNHNMILHHLILIN